MGDDQEPDKRSIYQIKVKETLDGSWSGWLDGLEITIEDDTTTLTGSVIDQAALHGVLAKIRDLNLTLVSIAQIETPPAEAKWSSRVKEVGK